MRQFLALLLWGFGLILFAVCPELSNQLKDAPAPPAEMQIAPHVPGPGAPAPGSPDLVAMPGESTSGKWEDYVYPIRIAFRQGGQQMYSVGCGVSAGGNQLYSAAHLSPSGRTVRCEVLVNGIWRTGVLNPVPQAGDFASVQVPGVQFPPLTIGRVDYREECWLFGLKSHVPQRGIFTEERTISLDPSCGGVVEGDSGGAVFNSRGELVGVINGYASGQPLSAKFAHLPGTAPRVNAPVSSAPQSSCPGGVCPIRRW